ncbi:MAG: citrate lyase holo-[acyl-carrier protein] synthase [Rhodoferax sp.]|nr:citrate lyase holo-[acyl-carrier protein] synthase [Rhodoferax sp.]
MAPHSVSKSAVSRLDTEGSAVARRGEATTTGVVGARNDAAPSNISISLTQMLDRREQRVADQQALLSRFGRPLVQLTLVTPGPVKDTAQTRFVFDQGLAAVHQALRLAGHVVLAQQGGYRVTGPEMLMVIDAEPLCIKENMLQIEERNALGRLWDVDVLEPSGASVSRQQLGWPARRCLLCDEPAHACARSGQHALADLQRAIEDKVHAFRNRLGR